MEHSRARLLYLFGFCVITGLTGGPSAFGQTMIDWHQIVQHPEKVFVPRLAFVGEIEDLGYGRMGNLDLTWEQYVAAHQDPENGEGKKFDFGKIVNIGKKLWEIITDNKPVVNIVSDTANALPGGTTEWTELQQWRAPESKVYRIQYKNGFGSTVVDYSYRVMFTAGGNVKGRGQYLSNVTTMPANLTVSWGYRFSAEGSVPAVLNVGTHEEPIGGIQLVMQWSVDTTLKHAEKSQEYFVRGDGGLFEINNN